MTEIDGGDIKDSIFYFHESWASMSIQEVPLSEDAFRLDVLTHYGVPMGVPRLCHGVSSVRCRPRRTRVRAPARAATR